MVTLNKIYTKTGDNGTTGLVGGSRVSKASLRMDAIGDIDETSAIIGMVRTAAEDVAPELSKALARIQNELFDVGAALATPAEPKSGKIVSIADSQIENLEKLIDQTTETLPDLKSFVLAGGSKINAQLHLARTVTRRAERTVTKLSNEENVPAELSRYINRLSDLLFVLARADAKRCGADEYLWEPEKTKS